MKLESLIKNVNVIAIKGNIKNIEIKNLCQKANKMVKNNLFFCYKGISGDGHDYALKAKNNGAIALIVEKFVDVNLPQILVKDVRTIMPKICNNFYNKVLNKLKFIGITGTNGKTTTSSLIYEILKNSGKKVGLIGTNGVIYDKVKIDLGFTTPDTIDFFEVLNKMQKYNVEYVVMEVSAHAIDLKKIKGLKFEVGIFTNLTQDHLDYFKTMHKYALCKLKFLMKNYCKNVFINIDDNYGKLFCKLSNSNVFTYGINSPAQNFAMDIKYSLTKTKFLANCFDNVCEIKTNLLCSFNVYNILAAICCAKLLNIDLDCIVNSINNIKSINGRMNCYNLKNNSIAIIDFAHTPDALKNVLESLNKLRNDAKLKSKIITVFGCGGNRDKTKRHLMGEIAIALSDNVIITNDNPRWENEKEIVNDILSTTNKKVCEIIYLRSKAIERAFEISNKDDLILIAGKGCEKAQEINGNFYVYSDEDEIKKYLK